MQTRVFAACPQAHEMVAIHVLVAALAALVYLLVRLWRRRRCSGAASGTEHERARPAPWLALLNSKHS